MTQPQPAVLTDPKQALLRTRIIWFALLMGQMVFLIAIGMTWNQMPGHFKPNNISQLLGYLSLGMLLTMTPMAMFMRNQIYKKNWQANIVTPQGYFLGMLIFLAMLESVAICGLVATLLNGKLGVGLVTPVIAMGIQIINFPNGRAMEPTEPNFGTGD